MSSNDRRGADRVGGKAIAGCDADAAPHRFRGLTGTRVDDVVDQVAVVPPPPAAGARGGQAGALTSHAIVKTTIFLTDMNDFAAVNDVYAEFFEKPYPARSTVAVAALPKGAKVEIEAIAMRE